MKTFTSLFLCLILLNTVVSDGVWAQELPSKVGDAEANFEKNKAEIRAMLKEMSREQRYAAIKKLKDTLKDEVKNRSDKNNDNASNATTPQTTKGSESTLDLKLDNDNLGFNITSPVVLTPADRKILRQKIKQVGEEIYQQRRSKPTMQK